MWFCYLPDVGKWKCWERVFILPSKANHEYVLHKFP